MSRQSATTTCPTVHPMQPTSNQRVLRSIQPTTLSNVQCNLHIPHKALVTVQHKLSNQRCSSLRSDTEKAGRHGISTALCCIFRRPDVFRHSYQPRPAHDAGHHGLKSIFPPEPHCESLPNRIVLILCPVRRSGNTSTMSTMT